jgi:arsenite methyltransferase
MPDCASCFLFQLESENDACLQTNRPGGLELTRKAIGLCGLPSRSSILDVANGTGASLYYLTKEKKYKAVGIDNSFQILKLGQKVQPGLVRIQADCRQIPICSTSQHCVLMECAFALSGGSDGALSEFNRILIPGGKLIISDVYIRELIDPRGLECLSGTICISGVVTEQFIRQQLTKFGFEVIAWQEHTLLLKKWLAQMVFKLGSLDKVYRHLAHSDEETKTLIYGLGHQIKLGYYLLIAQKS